MKMIEIKSQIYLFSSYVIKKLIHYIKKKTRGICCDLRNVLYVKQNKQMKLKMVVTKSLRRTHICSFKYL